MAIRPQETFNNIVNAGTAHISDYAREQLIQKTEMDGDGAFVSSFHDENATQNHGKKRDRDDAYQQMAAQAAIGNTSNLLMELGDLVFGADEINTAMDENISWLESQREMSLMIQEANQEIYMRNEDGSLMSQEQIDAYEDQNMVCVANPHDDLTDLMQLDSELASAHEVQQAMEAGEEVDFEQLPPSVQRTLIRDEITAKIEAGETVDLSSIPPEHRDTAIEAVIDAEQDAQAIALYEEYGFTEQDYRDGLLFNEGYDDLRGQYTDDLYDWRDERRAELETEAGVSDPEPTPDADLTEEQAMTNAGINSLLPPPSAG